MGKKGFNWKARQNLDTKIDNTETQKVCLFHISLCTNIKNDFMIILFVADIS